MIRITEATVAKSSGPNATVWARETREVERNKNNYNDKGSDNNRKEG